MEKTFKRSFVNMLRDEIIIESNYSDKLSKEINKSINKIDESMSYKDFASAVAKVLKDEYGTHNYKPFVSELVKKLKK